ncbi:hypothetical protein TNCV_167391 [Trichonephila clavipes]|nr:hypothetical protein TNCV_167391 [Trichonephila clavipes]
MLWSYALEGVKDYSLKTPAEVTAESVQTLQNWRRTSKRGFHHLAFPDCPTEGIKESPGAATLHRRGA